MNYNSDPIAPQGSTQVEAELHAALFREESLKAKLRAERVRSQSAEAWASSSYAHILRLKRQIADLEEQMVDAEEEA